MTDILGNSLITIMLGIAYLIALLFIFSKSRKLRTKFKAKSVIRNAMKLLNLKEIPLNKKEVTDWDYIYKQVKKLPDTRENFLLLRQIKDQILVRNI